MDMHPEWLAGIRAWSAANGNVAEMWLFGSRAKDTARPDSDVDLAIILTPVILATSHGLGHDWPLGNYMALGDAWRGEMETIVGRHVSLELFARAGEVESEKAAEARATAIRLWPEYAPQGLA